MRVEIRYKGVTYVTEADNDMDKSVEQVADTIRELVGKSAAFQFKLEDGSFLILGQDALKSATYRVIP